VQAGKVKAHKRLCMHFTGVLLSGQKTIKPSINMVLSQAQTRVINIVDRLTGCVAVHSSTCLSGAPTCAIGRDESDHCA
jgi:hypothetical protein